MLTNVKVSDLSSEFDLEIVGDADCVLNGISSVFEAEEGTLSFIRSAKYTKSLNETNASAIIVPKDVNLPDNGKTYLKSDNPYISFADILTKYYTKPIDYNGVSEKADIPEASEISTPCRIEAFVKVGDKTIIAENASIASNVSIGDNVRIGKNVQISSNVSIEDNTIIGDNVIINPGVVLGSDGFGFDQTGEGNYKFPQVGYVIIEDDVEIGANTSIDRGSIGPTVIGKGTKIDNQVQIGHGVKIGKHNVICSQVGIAGSVVTEDYVIFASKSGIGDHLKVGEKTIIGPMAGVTKDLPAGEIFSGFPAIPHKEWLKVAGIISQLPSLRDKLKFLKNFPG